MPNRMNPNVAPPENKEDEMRQLFEMVKAIYEQRKQAAGGQRAELGAAYETSQQPYQPSTMDQIAKWGGLGALGLGLIGGAAGWKNRGLAAGLGTLAGGGLKYAGGAPGRFRAGQQQTYADKVRMLGMDYGLQQDESAAGLAQVELGMGAHGQEQERMADEEKAAESARRFGLQHGLNVRREDRLSQAAKPMFTPSQELNQLGQRFDQRRIGFRNELDELLESRYPNQFGNLTSQGTVYAKPRRIQNLLDTGDIGEKVDRPGWFTGDDIYPDQDVQTLLDSLNVYDPSGKLDWQMREMLGGQQQQPGVAPPATKAELDAMLAQRVIGQAEYQAELRKIGY